MDPADPGRDALLVEQAGCLTWAGRPTGAEATCRALLVRDDDLAVTVRARISGNSCGASKKHVTSRKRA